MGSVKIAISFLFSKPSNCFLNLEFHSIYNDFLKSLYEMNFKVWMTSLYSSFKLFILQMEKAQYYNRTLNPTLFWYPKKSWVGDDQTKKLKVK